MAAAHTTQPVSCHGRVHVDTSTDAHWRCRNTQAQTVRWQRRVKAAIAYRPHAPHSILFGALGQLHGQCKEQQRARYPTCKYSLLDRQGSTLHKPLTFKLTSIAVRYRLFRRTFLRTFTSLYYCATSCDYRNTFRIINDFWASGVTACIIPN